MQPICFDNAIQAYITGGAIAIKKKQTKAAKIASTLGIGLQSFCIPGSVAEERKVGIEHGNLAAMLLSKETRCFAFLAGHESLPQQKGLMYLLQGTQPIPPDFSILLQEHTKKNATSRERNTFLWHPVGEQDAPSILITWLQDRPHME